MNFYDFTVLNAQNEEIALSDYKGKVILVVNTASECGFTPQYKELQALYEKLEGEDFEILGFPCNQFGNQEPGSDEEIQSFCQVNFGVTFPILKKVNVKGPDAHPLFKYLTQEAPGLLLKDIKWNFTKFLIDSEGHVVDRFAPTTSPTKMESDIRKLL
ncbi:glutathione peroxidase [Hazenella sp. IB182357]|uniref:Glutathione peroxidase n=1 Tax=Polycladospora coralii TaxID=2771432 RepID=A0A926NE15_9BACL|nr:glutathione peroxidase [Polycladospora coralii]MBD1371844.1 glutathione peroxidase [Polycladospora coralii]